MKRLKDTYLETLNDLVPLSGKNVLEIGCGNGSRTVQIAQLCEHITAIEPDVTLVEEARKLSPIKNGEYIQGAGESIPIQGKKHDVVFFTLSFHHVPVDKMHDAINEAIRLVQSEGRIVFFEPTFDGSFFEAELEFDACDGDERKEKAAAYVAMLSHQGIEETAELFDETVFSFESVGDFVESMHPKNATEQGIKLFLEKHNSTLRAQRRINIFKLAPKF